MLCRRPPLSYADLVDPPPAPWPSGSGRVQEVVRSRRARPPRARALVREAVRAGAFGAAFAGVAAHAQNGAFQEQALMLLAVLSHSGEAVPADEALWVRVQEAMRLHSGRCEVTMVGSAGGSPGCVFVLPESEAFASLASFSAQRVQMPSLTSHPRIRGVSRRRRRAC